MYYADSKNNEFKIWKNFNKQNLSVAIPFCIEWHIHCLMKEVKC